ncbi:MAG: TRAP transporter substrate-binding protein [Gammaproteobacteria bacterium]|nr:TRAP transporter substrate-binding protein [Gammaproteobacteria bacterium]
MKIIKFLTTTIALSFVAETQAANLNVSHFMPAKHPFQAVFMENWAADLNKCTNGEMNVQFSPAGSAFGHIAKQIDQVKAGVVDVAHGLTGVPRGRLPRTSIVDLPLIFDSASSVSNTLWDMHEQGLLADEFEGLKVLALHGHNPGLIHTKGEPARTPKDLEGLRIRFPSLAVSIMLEQLGANPVGLPPTQVYENLQKGVIDGTVFPWDAIGGMKLYEVLDSHVDANLYTTSFYFVMNEGKYNSLSDNERNCVDSISGRDLVNRLGEWWNQWDAKGLNATKSAGNNIISLTDEERVLWREKAKQAVGPYLKALADQGVENPQSLYDEVKSIAAKYNK